MTTKKFTVKYVSPDTLKPYYRNTKVHSEEHVRKLVKVLDRYHFDQPIVVSPDMVIIKGHGRYMASLLTQNKKLVPIIIRDDLTEEQMAAARISDNRLFELGEAIPELIQQEVLDFVSEGGALETQFLEFLPKGQVSVAAATKLFQSSDSPATSTPTPSASTPLPKAAVFEGSTDVVSPPKASTPKAAPAVYCPNCNQLHSE